MSRGIALISPNNGRRYRHRQGLLEETHARIDTLQVKKSHLSIMFENISNYYDILARLNNHIEVTTEQDHYIAAQKAKVAAVKVVLSKYQKQGEQAAILTDVEYVEAYEKLKKEKIIGPYLHEATLIVFGKLIGKYVGDKVRTAEYLPWAFEIQDEFSKVSIGDIPMPVEFMSIQDFKRSNDMGSWPEYKNQFDRYNSDSAELEAKQYSYEILETTGLNYFQSLESPERAWMFDLQVSPQTGSGWQNVNDHTRDSYYWPGTYAANFYALPGTIGVIELANGNVILLSTIDGYCSSSLLTKEEVGSNSALQEIMTGRYNQGQRTTTLHGAPLIKNLLRHLWSHEYNPIVLREKSYTGPAGQTSNGAFPLLQSSDKPDYDIDVQSKTTLDVIQEIAEKGLKKASDRKWSTLKDENFWDVMGRHFVPFYSITFDSLYDPTYELDSSELFTEIFMTALMLVPLVGAVGKLTLVMKQTLKTAIKQGTSQGLRGSGLRAYVKKSLITNPQFLSELKRVGIKSTEALWELVDPTPIPFSGLSPSMIKLSKPNGISPNRKTFIDVGDRRVDLELPSRDAHHDGVIQQPISHRLIDRCQHVRHKRALGDSALIPCVNVPEAQGSGAIAAQQQQDPINYIRDLVRSAPKISTYEMTPDLKCFDAAKDVMAFLSPYKFKAHFVGIRKWLSSQTQHLSYTHYAVVVHYNGHTIMIDPTGGQSKNGKTGETVQPYYGALSGWIAHQKSVFPDIAMRAVVSDSINNLQSKLDEPYKFYPQLGIGRLVIQPDWYDGSLNKMMVAEFYKENDLSTSAPSYRDNKGIQSITSDDIDHYVDRGVEGKWGIMDFDSIKPSIGILHPHKTARLDALSKEVGSAKSLEELIRKISKFLRNETDLNMAKSVQLYRLEAMAKKVKLEQNSANSLSFLTQ